MKLTAFPAAHKSFRGDETREKKITFQNKASGNFFFPPNCDFFCFNYMLFVHRENKKEMEIFQPHLLGAAQACRARGIHSTPAAAANVLKAIPS